MQRDCTLTGAAHRMLGKHINKPSHMGFALLNFKRRNRTCFEKFGLVTPR